MAELNADFVLKTVLPRVVKATLWGSITFLVLYYLPMMLLTSDVLPADFSVMLLDFSAITIFFVIVGQLFSGTIIGCAFGIARALFIMVYFFTASEGGVFSVILPITDVRINFTFDISIILLMIVSVNLFDISKNLLEAISILTEKTTEMDIT